MDLDVFANFFLGLFVGFAHTLGFASGLGQGDDAKGYDHCPANFDDGVHFLSLIKAVIRACITRAHEGCGKFQPTNAPTAIHNMISNIFYLLRFLGVVVATVHQRLVLVLVLAEPQVLQMLALVRV